MCYGPSSRYTERPTGQWCRDDYGLQRHNRTLRAPREHFEAVEQPALRPAPTGPYDNESSFDPGRDRAVHEPLRLVGARGRRGLEFLAEAAGPAHEGARLGKQGRSVLEHGPQ